jgi:subtilisin family serine protease
VVANGEELYSSLAGSNASYGIYSGTSMASPNAMGSAALLVKYFADLFPGQAMRASTLKALLIHTADDRGNAGPDYQYGWGLVNVKAAADALTPTMQPREIRDLIESRLTTATPARTHTFTWDGISPIRATLVWTDPAGIATTTHDNRTARS